MKSKEDHHFGGVQCVTNERRIKSIHFGRAGGQRSMGIGSLLFVLLSSSSFLFPFDSVANQQNQEFLLFC